MTTEQLLTKQEVSERLRVHLNTVSRYIETGALPAVKLEGVVRIRAVDLEKFISDRVIKPCTDTKQP